MATLQGQQINNTYPGLIKTNDEAAVDGTLKNLQDGAGNDLPIQVSSTEVNFTGTVSGVPAGPQGPQGPEGPQGIEGPQGPEGPQGAGQVVSVVAGTNVTVDATDPANPIVSATGGGGAAGLVSGTGSDSMVSAATLTSLPAQAAGTNDIAIGDGAIAGDPNNIDATSKQISIGTNIASNYADEVIRIGNDIPGKPFNGNNIFIGKIASIGGRNTTVVGYTTGQTYGDGGVGLGAQVTVGDGGVSIGYNTKSVSGGKNVLVGNEAGYITGGQYRAVSIGDLSGFSNNTNTVQIGYSCTAKAPNAIAIGSNARVDSSGHTNAIAIGEGSRSGGANTVALGNNVTSIAWTDSATVNQLAIVNFANLDYADDTAAATGGVPLGGVYHTAGTMKIRIV